MPQRIAAITSIAVFMGCLVTGALGAENSFITAVERALAAMAVTLFLGLIVGWMGQKMVHENISQVIKAAATTAEQSPVNAKASGSPATKSTPKPVTSGKK